MQAPPSRNEDYESYLSVYCPFSLEYETIAEYRNRPKLLTEALVNRKISVLEVKNLDGTRSFVEKEKQQPTQTIVRTLAEGIKESSDGSVSPTDAIKASLRLTASAAVEVGLADNIMDSLSDVLAEIKTPHAQLTNASGVESVVKKYKAARRNIAGSLSRVQWLEDRSAFLEKQLTEIEKQLRTGTVTREVTQRSNSTYRRDDSTLPENYTRYYYDPEIISTGRVHSQGDSYTTRRRDDRRHNPRQSETVVIEQPAASVGQVQRELVAVLNDLITEYRRLQNLAKRWPGGLPLEIPYQTLVQNRNSAVTLRDYLLSQLNTQQQIPGVPPVNQQNRY